MLRYLNIQRLALIEALAIDLAPGLTVLTGETGAGKSIVIDAISLITGGRASGDLVRTGADTCSVQAVIETIENKELIVRREVSSTGRGRAFLDDTLVTAASLKAALDGQIELHGQHEQQRLLSPAAQVEVLDAFAGLAGDRIAVATAHQAWSNARQALDALSMDERERAARVEWLAFQLGEFDKVAPGPNELHDLRAERQRLMNADRLERLLVETQSRLEESDESVLSQLAGIWKRLQELAALDPAYQEAADLRATVESPLRDLSHQLHRSLASLESAAERLEQVEERLAALERLARRFAGDLDGAAAQVDDMRVEHARLVDADSTRASLEQSLEAARASYLRAARRLSAARQRHAKGFSEAVTPHLADLALERAELTFAVEADEDEHAWTARGFDAVELLFAPNPGEQARPLHRIASGGELSRVMLAIETLTSGDEVPRTLIFDEVDAGVSGRVADAVGRRLRALSERHQVLVVSHLPQVASAAHHHLRVEKRVADGRTTTEVVELTAADRVEEIARLMAGAQVTANTRAAAQEMLSAHAPEGRKAKAKGERAKVRS